MRIELQKGRRGLLRFGEKALEIEILAVAQDTIGVRFAGSGHPAEGTGGDLEFGSDASALAYHVQVAVGARDGSDTLILQRVPGAPHDNYRRAWRVPMNVKTNVRGHNDPRAAKAVIINLSADGALIESAAMFDIEELVDLRLPLPGESPQVVHARVIRTEPSEPPSDAVQRYGVRFLELTTEATHSLTFFIWKRLWELYPKEIAQLLPRRSRRPRSPGAPRAQTEGDPEQQDPP
ncbi:MAG TPA: PilZ domain-containing protein [Candidatus Hydrogenedentes bacterium]|nr:PilZ domain-containing protein [Candidatus Hydrogenedentota bacterium]